MKSSSLFTQLGLIALLFKSISPTASAGEGELAYRIAIETLSGKAGQALVARALSDPASAEKLARLLGVSELNAFIKTRDHARTLILLKLTANPDPEFRAQALELLGLGSSPSSGLSRAEVSPPRSSQVELAASPSSELTDTLGFSSTRVSDAISYDAEERGLRSGTSFYRRYRMRPLEFAGFRTMGYFPPHTKTAIERSAVVVVPFHGMNATISHAGSSLPFLNSLIATPGIYAETIDQPGSGNNPDFSPLDSLESTLAFYTEYLKDLKRRANGRPLIAIGFCYSSGFLIEVNKRNPGLIDGLVLTGLIIPDRAMGLDYSIAVESKMYADGAIRANPAVRDRADHVYGQLAWSHDQNPFGYTPTLILIGENDPFMTDQARNRYQDWAKISPSSIRYLSVIGGGHGVLGPINGHPESTEAVREAILGLTSQVATLPTP